MKLAITIAYWSFVTALVAAAVILNWRTALICTLLIFADNLSKAWRIYRNL